MSNDSEQNLTVLTEHILHLAEKQHKAVDQITGANRSIVDPAREVLDTHGLACGATNLAVAAVETTRRTAGAALLRVSTELGEDLKTAVSRYDGTDSAEGGNLDRCEL
jgi:Excreted virulence factor EspC, type VII ESX diderm